jgi:hypothetical protein
MRDRWNDRGGFTVVELLIYLIIAVVVVAAIYQVLMGQNRLYMKQRELQDVRTSVRAAANLLAFEFRQLSAAEGDVYLANQYDVAIRSMQASGIICAKHGSQFRYGIFNASGDFTAETGDSILIFAAGGAGTADDQWLRTNLKKLFTPAVGGVPDCAWTAVSESPALVVEIDTAGVGSVVGNVQIGAPIRQFHRVQYGSYWDGSRWWLGRKVGSASDWERLTGPLSPPSDSGLVFVYYDETGNVTADVTQIRMIDIILRGESFGKAPKSGSLNPQVQEDSLTLRVSLRG